MLNWLLIIVLAIFLIGITVGAVKGFLKVVLSLFSAVISIALMIVLNPYISDLISTRTPIKSFIEQKLVEKFIPDMSEEEISKLDLSGTPLENYSNEDLSYMSWSDWVKTGISLHDIIKIIGNIPKDIQNRQLKESPLPKFLKERLMNNNNRAVYEKLGVASFPEYAASYLARMTVKLISFLITFILTVLIVKALSAAFEVIGDLPIIGWLNRTAGAVVGFLIALLIVWVVFLFITIIHESLLGKITFEMIEQSPLLTSLYEKNILLEMLLKF